VLEARPKLKDRPQHRAGLRRFRKAGVIALYVFPIGLLLTASLAVYRARPTADSPRNPMITAGQHLVRKEIDGEFQTAFGGFDETTVEPLPNNKYRISGWVDVISKDGIRDRMNFTCIVYRTENGDWVGEKVAVIP